MRTIITIIFILIHAISYPQSGIGRKAPRGALDVNNANGTNTSGLVLPTTDDVNKIVNPQGGTIAPGTLIYDSKNDCIRYFIAKTNSWSDCISVIKKDVRPTTPDLTINCNGIELDNYDSPTITGTVNNVTVTSTMTYTNRVTRIAPDNTSYCGIIQGQYLLGGADLSSRLDIKFNKNVSNFKILQTVSHPGESVTITTKRNGAVLTTTSITASTSVACNTNLRINGMTVADNRPSTSNNVATAFSYIIVGDWFDEITITHNGAPQGSNANGSRFRFCIGDAQEL